MTEQEIIDQINDSLDRIEERANSIDQKLEEILELVTKAKTTKP